MIKPDSSGTCAHGHPRLEGAEIGSWNSPIFKRVNEQSSLTDFISLIILI